MDFKTLFFDNLGKQQHISFHPKKLKHLEKIKHHKNICIVANENKGKSYLIRKIYSNNGELPKSYEHMLIKDKYYTFYKRNNFFEINCSHLGYKDKHILYHFLNDLSTINKTIHTCKIVYIRNIHDLTLDALYTLRGLIDQFEKTLHFVFSSKTSQSFPPALLSRMIMFSLGNININQKICRDLGVPVSDLALLKQKFKENNQKIEISLLDYYHYKNKDDYVYIEKKFCNDIAVFFDKKITMKTIHDFRDLIYDIMMNQIHYEKILEMMYLEAQKKKTTNLLELWSYCNFKLMECYRPIFIFELFWLKASQLE